MTTPAPQPQREYIITEEQLKLIEMYAKCSDTHMLALEVIRSRPHTPSPKVPNSTELTQLAINDWHNREERKHRYELQPWVNGWITGFLSESKPHWSNERETAIRNAERNATLDAVIEFTKGNSETIEADDGTLEDAVFLGELLAKIGSLRGES